MKPKAFLSVICDGKKTAKSWTAKLLLEDLQLTAYGSSKEEAINHLKEEVQGMIATLKDVNFENFVWSISEDKARL